MTTQSWDSRDLLVKQRILNDVSDFYNSKLESIKEGKKGLKYLKSRGFGISDIVINKLGYSDGKGLLKFLLDKGYRLSDTIKHGFINHELQETFCDRIILPCIDQDNKTVLGLTSRLIEDKENQPKYKNLPRSRWKMFSPANIKPKQYIHIVEGPFDVLTLKKFGYSAVCFMGTNGWNAKYAPYFNNIKFDHGLFCFPDFESTESQAYKANVNQYIKIALALGSVGETQMIPYNMYVWGDEPPLFFGSHPKDFNEILTILATSKKAKQVEKEFHRQISNLLLKSTHFSKHPMWLEYWEEKNKIKTFQTPGTINSFKNYSIEKVINLLNVDIIREDSIGEKIYCHCFNPDHEDSTPSCVVYLDTNSFHCFGCGEHGRGVDAVMLSKRKSYRDALNWLRMNYN